MPDRLTRRGFLRVALLGTGTVLLYGCGVNSISDWLTSPASYSGKRNKDIEVQTKSDESTGTTPAEYTVVSQSINAAIGEISAAINTGGFNLIQIHPDERCRMDLRGWDAEQFTNFANQIDEQTGRKIIIFQTGTHCSVCRPIEERIAETANNLGAGYQVIVMHTLDKIDWSNCSPENAAPLIVYKKDGAYTAPVLGIPEGVKLEDFIRQNGD